MPGSNHRQELHIKNWDDIRIFLEVAEAGSTLAAANKLGVAQTTVSRRMDALERDLNIRLFRREARGYSLTVDGARLFDAAKPIKASFAQFEREAGDLVRAHSDHIRISAPAEGMRHWLMPVLEGFREHNPGLALELDTSELKVDLIAGEADLALRLVDEIDDERLIARRIGAARWGVYCSRQHHKAYGAPRDLEEARLHSVIQYRDSIARKIAPVRWFEDHLASERVVVRVSSVPGMVSALRSSGGVGVLPCVVGDDTSDLVPCFRDEAMQHNCWVVTSPEAHARPLVRRCMSWIAENFPRGDL